MGCLEGLLQLEQAIKDKLMHGHPLDASEQSFYDDASDLKESTPAPKRKLPNTWRTDDSR